MKVTRVYTGEDGKSHFEEVEYELQDSPVGRVSGRIEATGVIFRETPGPPRAGAPRCLGLR